MPTYITLVKLTDQGVKNVKQWSEKIQEAMETAHSGGLEGSVEGRRVTLKRPVPVYIVYLTAFVRDGELNFRRDPYGKASETLTGLGTLSPSEPRLCEELQKLLEG